MASNSENLYVTCVDFDRDLLKIWGQRNRIAATFIEKQLLQLLPSFNNSQPPNPGQIHKGMFCFAKYTDDNYYRARVISRVQVDSVAVVFVDYGNKDIIKLSNVRLQEGNESDVLVKMSEQAEEYYLAGVTALPQGWTKENLSEIRRDVCYDDFAYQIICQVGDQKILELQFHNEDFSSYLVRKKLASPLSLPVQRHLILSYCSLVSTNGKPETVRDAPRAGLSPDALPHNNMRVPLRPPNERNFPVNYEKKNQVNFSNPPPPTQYYSPRSMHSGIPPVSQNIPKNSYFPPVNHPSNPVPLSASSPHPVDPAFNPILNSQYNPMHMVKENRLPFNNNSNNIIQLLAQQVKQYIAEDNAKTESEKEMIPHHYVNRVLEVGSTYNVLISFIDDGPWSFSIQLLSSETELQKLMDELSTTELVPIKPPIILGHPCIASSTLYGNLCRGVVVSISHCAVKVYFVDFGNTEDLPSSSIYELPPRFFKIRVLSEKFSLSGLQKVVYSDEIKKFFKEVVQDELLMLRVTSLEDDNLPTCELYLKDKNIKRILNEKIREFRTSVDDFPKVGDTEFVLVTWIVSPQKFFVQLHKRDADLAALREELSEIETKGQKLTYQQLSVGFRCVCQYKNDGDWYRAVITSVDSENAITVFYVDFGNTEIVNISRLRRVSSSCLINQMSNQAIQCTLKGFENRPFDQETTNKLEALILEKELQMKVVSLEKELLCVQLFDNGRDIASELLIATPPKLNSLETSSQDQSDVLSVWSSPVSADAKEKEKKANDVGGTYDRTGNKGFRGDKNRHKSKKGQHMTHFQNFKSPIQETPAQPKIWLDTIETWGEEKPKDNHRKEPNQNSWKPRGSKQNENGYDWDNQNGKSGGYRANKDDWNENGRNRGTRQARNGLDYGYENEKKKYDDRKFVNGETKRFDGNRARDDDSRKKFDRNDERKRKPIRKEDAAPPGSKYEERILELNTSERGLVTYYFNPHEFYVQLLSQEEEFKKMMADIQVYYTDKYSLRDPVQAGDILIAQFSLDKVLYRAEVIKPSPVTVRYVDYGNPEPVSAKGTWLLDKRFLKLPKQVIKCRLANIEPIEADWPPPDSGIEKFFEMPEYKCTFLNFDGDTYEISMEDTNGRDVAKEIIAAGLAASKGPKPVVLDFDFCLLPKQILRLCISYVESPSKFYVILNPNALKVIKNELGTLCKSKKLTPLSEASIKPETRCLTTSDDGSWHRGRITKTEGEKVFVWLCDRGDRVQVTTDKVMNLPDSLKVFQPQAVECTLYGTQDIQNDEFKKAVEGKEHLVFIASATLDCLTVVLYNEEGQKLDFHSWDDFPQTVEPVGQLPIIGQEIPVLISHLETPKEIYVQRSMDWDDLENLSNQLSNRYSTDDEIWEDEADEKEVKGTLVAAKSVIYDTWYRGRLVSSSDDGFEVFYVDYGNKEVLPKENVKTLDSSFLKFNALCKKLTLDAEFDEDKTEDVKNRILELCQDKELLTYFVNKEGEFLCEFTLNNERITPTLKTEGLLSNDSNIFVQIASSRKTPKKPVPEQEETEKWESERDPEETEIWETDREPEETEIWETDREPEETEKRESEREAEELKVFVSHIDSPKLFWVHKENTINELQKFQDKLQASCESLPDKDDPQVGDVVAAVFSKTWYRARVKKVEDNILTVQFMDYGNTLNVDVSFTAVKELPDDFVRVPVFATPFSLRGVWSEDLTPKFEEIILRNEDPVTVVVLEESDPPVVDLLRNGQSFTEMLRACDDDDDDVVVDNDNDKDDVEEERKEEAEEFEGSNLCTAYITFSDSPNDFYVQRESCTDVLNGLTEQMLEAEGFETAERVEVNEMYAAKFPDDGAWYRARVTKRVGDEIEVLFVDYGNSSKVSEVKRLPGNLTSIPDLAERCSLLYGDSCDDWSDAACEKFAEYADGRELKMKVAAKVGKKLLVDLFRGEASVREKLEALCEKDGRREVYVSHAVSPAEFYIQYVDDEEYRGIAEKLESGDEAEELESRTPGTICQALFAEDGYWYRAKILKTLDDGCEVSFIDFGNVSVSTELKKLPEEIVDIPPRALRCSLILPKKNIPQSAAQEFVKLTAGGAAVFRARIISPGETNLVSLKLRGRILEETLNLEKVEETNGFSADSDLADELTGESVAEETGEEKGGESELTGESESFKSEEEKGVQPSSVVHFVQKTYDEAIRSMSEKESTSELSTEDSRDEGLVVDVGEAEEETNESEEKTESFEEWGDTSGDGVARKGVLPNGMPHKIKDLEHADGGKTSRRNKVHKIVPGCISRGEEEDVLADTTETAYQKVNYSEKVVPGSVSRGIDMESATADTEPAEESPEERSRQSPPTTSRPSRDSFGYVKIDPNDRVVPGCISTGTPLLCSPAGEKIPATEKIVSGAVNGSFEEN